MKVGDKYLCKKPACILQHNYYCYITENNYYIIIYSDMTCMDVYPDDYVHKDNTITFSKYTNDYSLYFYDYFYTKQEERKFKLEKLNESR